MYLYEIKHDSILDNKTLNFYDSFVLIAHLTE